MEEQHDNASLDSDDWSSDTDKSSESDSELDFEGKRMEDLRKFFLKYGFYLLSLRGLIIYAAMLKSVDVCGCLLRVFKVFKNGRSTSMNRQL